MRFITENTGRPPGGDCRSITMFVGMSAHPLTFRRATSADPTFCEFVDQLNAYLAPINGEEHTFYDSHSKTDSIPHVLVAYQDELAVGCGALRELAPGTVEIKRMYVPPAGRGQGVGSRVLAALEAWAAELGFERAVLETGNYMPDALALYRKNGYAEIERYPPYVEAERSVCFGKMLVDWEED